MVQNITLGDSDFIQFMRLRNELVVENPDTDRYLFPTQITTLSRDIEKQLKVVNNMVDVVDRPNKDLSDPSATQ